jgi:hypothetical protein
VPRRSASRTLRETDLYGPVKAYLERSGYEVRGEVADCDITAVREDELVVVELKRSFGLKLVMQAVNRQKAADSVYVAIPKPPRGRFSKGFWDMCHLLGRLELGLLTVTFRGDEPAVELVLHPEKRAPARNTKLRRSIIREFTGRSGDYNTGGSSKQGLVTAYRETALRVACCLERYGPLSAAELKAMGTGDKTWGILYRNVYGWFEKVETGRYALHKAGKGALGAYPELRARIRKELPRRARARPRPKAAATRPGKARAPASDGEMPAGA